MRQVGMLVVLLGLAGPATGGELLLANGSRIQGDLTNETLVLSTGSELVELAPDWIGVLTPGEVRLKDGRVIRGTLVGGRLKAHTALGELAIKVDELRLFRADGGPAVAAPGPGHAVPGATLIAAGAPPAGVRVASPPPAPRTQEAGLAPVTLYQQGTPAQAEPTPPPSTPSLEPPPPVSGIPTALVSPTAVDLPAGPARERRLEVLTPETSLHRDALAKAATVGTVHRGEQVTYLDSIDRRLWVMNRLIFDGGHWIKLRTADGTEGWVPANAVREVR